MSVFGSVSSGLAAMRYGMHSLGFMGDSRLFSSISRVDSGSTAYRVGQCGVANWLQILTGFRLRAYREYQWAYSGKSTADMLADLPAVMASDVEAVLVWGSVNDSNENGTTIPYGTSANNIEKIIRGLVSVGKIVIVVPETPRFVGWDESLLQRHQSVRQRIYNLQHLPGVIVLDTWPKLAQPTGEQKSGVYYDNTHPAPLGNFLIAQEGAERINLIWPAPVFLPVVNTGYWDANRNPTGLLTANPMMTGTGGTKQAGTGGSVTGNVADGWTLTNAPGGVNTVLAVAASKVTDDNGDEWQEITVSGTAAGANERVELYRTFTTTNVAQGHTVETMAQIEVDAGTVGMWGPYLSTGITGGGNSGAGPMTNWFTSGADNGPPLDLAYAGPLLTPPFTLLGTPTGARASLFVHAEQGVSDATITFRVRAFGMRKV